MQKPIIFLRPMYNLLDMFTYSGTPCIQFHKKFFNWFPVQRSIFKKKPGIRPIFSNKYHCFTKFICTKWRKNKLYLNMFSNGCT